MDKHLNSPEHAAERAELVAAVLAACGGSGIDPAAIEKLGTLVGCLFDLGCQLDLELAIAACGIGRPGGTERFLDTAHVSFTFPDAEPLREEAAKKQWEYEIKQERGN